MKKLFLLLWLFFIPVLSIFAQIKQINIQGRPLGSATYVDVSATVSDTCIINGFQIEVKRVNNSLMPQDFYLSPKFYQGWKNGGWNYPKPHYDGKNFIFAAVGDPAALNAGENIGTFKIYVDPWLSGKVLFSTKIRVFDEETDWSAGFGEFKIINLPFEIYGNYNNDGEKNVKDGVELWKWVGLIPNNDTLLVAFDLDGTGEITDYDEYLLLDNIVNQTPFPIFSNNTIVVAGNRVPIDVMWSKTPDGRWGLYAKEEITNGNISGKNLSNISLPNGSSFMLKKVNEKSYFFGQKAIPVGKQILVSNFPDYSITGKFNNNRPIKVAMAVTDVENNETIPINFSLEQNYPNPFNPTTTIHYKLQESGNVKIDVINLLGQNVITLVDEFKLAGQHDVKFNASGLSSGVYMYKISTGNFVQVKKMLLMK